METNEILAALKKAGTEPIRKIFLKHGAVEPIYGVKVEDIKKIQRQVKNNQQEIAMELFESGVGEAQYMAGLMAHGSKMTKKQLQHWAKSAQWPMISESTVPWVTNEHPDAMSIALEWINDKRDNVASSGWHTLGCIVATKPDEELDMGELKKLMKRVEKEIHDAPNRIKYCMNNFLISMGSYVKPLSDEAMGIARKIGIVTVDMGDTSCKVPFAPDYIQKVIGKGNLGKKKKTPKC